MGRIAGIYSEVFSCRTTSRTRRGRAAFGVLIGVAFLSAFAGGAFYYLLMRPQVTDKLDPGNVNAESPDSNVKDAVEPIAPGADLQATKSSSLEDANAPEQAAAAEVAESNMQAASEIDPEQQEELERIDAIKSGNWTTRRIVALTTFGPYVIDFHTSIAGKSLEETERENLDAIADQLLSAPPPKPDQPMMAQGDPTSDANTDETQLEEAQPEEAQPEEAASEEMQSGEIGTAQEMERGKEMDQQSGDAAGHGAELEISWTELLDQPLVAAGWLGNLIAEDEQRDQLISMYDSQRDDMVSRDELRDFLSRGLSRRHPVQLADIGNSPDARDTSPWGPFDLNEDYVLDPGEAGKILERFKDMDMDGDKAITLAEARPASMQTIAQSLMVLAARTLYIVDPVDNDTSEAEQLRKFGNLAARVIEHYTFLAELPLEKWPGYPRARWQAIDKDESGGIDRYEMRRLFQLPAEIDLFLRFDPDYESGFVIHAELAAEEAAADLETTQAEAPVDIDRGFSWVAANSGGRLSVDGLSLQINVEDVFSSSSREYVVGQVQAALENAQLATALRTTLQLGDDALELVDGDGDGKLDGLESDRLWQWLTARQSTRLEGRWMLAPEPWFQLLDRTADGSVSESEAAWLSEGFGEMFGDGEAVLGAGDPLLAQFAVRRADPRLENNASMASPDSDDQPAAPLDWFSAMDLNSDGSIDESEFLGDIPDFSALDVNKDGYLRRSELYVP